MPTDYSNAARRHWEDGRYLHNDNRLANADHLFGFTAECALKAVMIGLGLPVNSEGSPSDRKYKIHINDLWDEFQTFAHSRCGARYSAPISGVNNPFDDWHVKQRYFHQADIVPVAADSHKNGAQMAMTTLETAILDGVVQ